MGSEGKVSHIGLVSTITSAPAKYMLMVEILGSRISRCTCTRWGRKHSKIRVWLGNGDAPWLFGRQDSAHSGSSSQSRDEERVNLSALQAEQQQEITTHERDEALTYFSARSIGLVQPPGLARNGVAFAHSLLQLRRVRPDHFSSSSPGMSDRECMYQARFVSHQTEHVQSCSSARITHSP